ncbi:hypothetical protein COJ40_09190 [Bacillus cereus]|nr:hypothetical protein COJ40_09190 [Bacillus cereus]
MLYYSELNNFIITLHFWNVKTTSGNDNYVNKLSIWAAYCIFCLACFFRNAGDTPYFKQEKHILLLN